jgi:hypothetical protein
MRVGPCHHPIPLLNDQSIASRMSSGLNPPAGEHDAVVLRCNVINRMVFCKQKVYMMY